MKKKLLALLLCLTMLLVMLPTVAMADPETPEDTRNPVVQFTIVKKVEKAENAATPPAKTFEFVLEDTANEEKSLSDYGITLLDDLKIETNGVGTYEKTVRAKIDVTKVNENGGWQAIIPEGSIDVSSYNKSFHITEKNDGDDGWEYSTAKYEVKFKRDFDPQGNATMTCGVYQIGNDVMFRTAEFTNTYTANSSTIIIVPETTEAAPNPTTGAAPANLGLGCVVIGLAAMGAVAYARKK